MQKDKNALLNDLTFTNFLSMEKHIEYQHQKNNSTTTLLIRELPN